MRRAALLALALALLVVPSAGAVGLSISYTVTRDCGRQRLVPQRRHGADHRSGRDRHDLPGDQDVLHEQRRPSTALPPTGNAHASRSIFSSRSTQTLRASPARRRAERRRERLVQQAGVGLVHRLRRNVGHRIVHAPRSYGGPDSSRASVSGTCRDNAGNVSAASTLPTEVRRDGTVGHCLCRLAPPTSGGWYNQFGRRRVRGIRCDVGNRRRAPARPRTRAPTRRARRSPARASTTPATAQPDRSRSSTTGRHRRPPRRWHGHPTRTGWYTKPVAVTFSGADALSGLADCTAAKTYGGPDNGSASVKGTCSDNAGNTTTASAPLKYDATAPRLQNVEVVPGGGDVTLTWKQPADVTSVAVTRTPGRKGKAPTVIYKGRTPHVRDTGLKAGRRLPLPADEPRRSGQPIRRPGDGEAARALRAGGRQGRTRRDCVALERRQEARPTTTSSSIRGSKKVLSTWPVGTSFRLPGSWTYAGHRYKLTRGKYRWFVWPGRGARARAQYGKLLGSSSFVVR